MQTIEAIVRNGHIVPVEKVELEEGSKVLVTLAETYDDDFWLSATGEALKTIWDNEDDDVYAELLTK